MSRHYEKSASAGPSSMCAADGARYVWGSYLEESHGVFSEHASRYPAVSLAHVEAEWVLRGASLIDVVERVAGEMGPGARYYALRGDRYVIQRGATLVMLDPTFRSDQNALDVIDRLEVPARVAGPRREVERLVEALDALMGRATIDRTPTARWWFRSRTGVASTAIEIRPPSRPVVQECYPWVPDLESYLTDYLSEESSTLLFLAGPPGTGKTSLLKHVICEHRLRVAIAYDDAIFERDKPFIDFMTGDDLDMLIIEDADLLLTSREHAGNKLMSRFLNVSDGIIRFPKKKIVFTTNLHDFNDVDAALLRQGRCHGFLHARELTYDEVARACAALRLEPVQRKPRDGTFTLAEIFNPGQVATVPRIGFMGG